MKVIEIFKAGTHVDMNGNKQTLTVADLVNTAKVYNPSLHEAPLVLGHPKTNSPAYGWASKLEVDGDRLIAYPSQVNPEFSEQVENGAWKKRSSSFYPPNAANNPVPGSWYLRHIGFLGAQPPAVKGLKEVEFSDSDECVEFRESHYSAFRLIGNLLARMRDFMIEKNGVEEADKCLSSWDLNFLQELANESVEPTPSFSETGLPPQPTEPQPEGDKMSEELKTQLDAETAKREAAEKELAALKAEKAAAETASLEKANAEFAENLVKEGKLLPKNKEKVVFMLNAAPQSADFSEGESFVDALKGLLSESPKVIDFSETAKKGTQQEDATHDYAEGADPVSIGMDQKINAYMKEHNVDYVTAFSCVTSG